MDTEQFNAQLYDSIFTRKSCRKYDMTPLNETELEIVQGMVNKCMLLNPDMQLQTHIVNNSQVKGIAMVKAPHYLIVSGHRKQGELLNTGFLFEQWSLWMSANGYGCVWLGGTSPIDSEKGTKAIIAIAFGRTEDIRTRNTADFKRKPLEEISTGTDMRLEAARLAPSGLNGQPWYFIVSDHPNKETGNIYVYQKLSGMLKLVYNLSELDIGISLSHLYLASEHQGIPFVFTAIDTGAPKPPKGYKLIGVVK